MIAQSLAQSVDAMDRSGLKIRSGKRRWQMAFQVGLLARALMPRSATISTALSAST